MCHVLGVRVRERRKHAAENLDGAVQRQLTMTREPGTQRRAFDEAPRMVHECAGSTAAAGDHEGRVGQPVRDQQQLPPEARGSPRATIPG